MLITCLGISGSGKTSFLAALIDTLFTQINAYNGFYLLDYHLKDKTEIFADNLHKQEISFVENLPRLSDDFDDTEGFNGFPEGTKSTRLRDFSLMMADTLLIDIGWLDYRGGVLTDPESSNEEQDELLENLILSSSIIIYLDATRLIVKSTKQAGIFVGADKISRVLTLLHEKKRSDYVNLLFVLTQIDALPISEGDEVDWFGNDGDCGPLKQRAIEVFGGVMDTIKNTEKWTCGIIAVSAVGMGNSTRTVRREATFNKPAITHDRVIGFPFSVNVKEAFFWLILREMEQQKRANLERVKTLESEKNSLLSKSARVQFTKETAKAVHDQEERRISGLKFIDYIWEKTVERGQNERKLNQEINDKVNQFNEKQRSQAQKLQQRILGSKNEILKYEDALGPIELSIDENVMELK